MKKVLIATSAGGHPEMNQIESLLAMALTLRGAETHIFLCDGLLPGCMQATLWESERRDGPGVIGPTSRQCKQCRGAGLAMYEPLGLPIHQLGQWVEADEIVEAKRCSQEIGLDQISAYRVDGLAIGEHAEAGALRYFARGDLADEPQAERVLRRYFEAALLTRAAIERLIATERYDTIVFNHGIYVPQGIIGEVARARGVRVVNWIPAYRSRRFIFSHDDTYHHTMMNEPTDVWENIAWTPEMESEIVSYLQSRWYGTHDWIWFHDKPQEDFSWIQREVGFDLSKPIIAMLTNVIWDAQLHYPANAFPSMVDWVLKSIAYFRDRPDLQLVIRVHPAEIRGSIPSRQPLVEEIQTAFPELPPNVFVVGPDSNVSTYALTMQCNAVIIYGTKTGVELTSFGIPVIVAGEAWIRNKGITIDAESEQAYYALLNALPLDHALDRQTKQRARSYAYHFFFRRMIPLNMINPVNGWPRFRINVNDINELRPGTYVGLDVICDGILNGSRFIYPAETIGSNPAVADV